MRKEKQNDLCSGFIWGKIPNCALDIVMIAKNLLKLNWKGDGTLFFFFQCSCGFLAQKQ